jgi:hypothetical protein
MQGRDFAVTEQNLAISHNLLLNADTSLGGAIATRVSSNASADPYALTTIQIFRNDIQGVPEGIWIDSKPGFQQTWRSVLYNNLFSGVGIPVIDDGQESVFMP